MEIKDTHGINEILVKLAKKTIDEGGDWYSYVKQVHPTLHNNNVSLTYGDDGARHLPPEFIHPNISASLRKIFEKIKSNEPLVAKEEFENLRFFESPLKSSYLSTDNNGWIVEKVKDRISFLEDLKNEQSQ